MSEPLVCEGCGHTDDLHDAELGYCNARGCRCVCFRLNDFEDEDEGLDDNEPLDFEHGQ
jgi:hypothetical protein